MLWKIFPLNSFISQSTETPVSLLTCCPQKGKRRQGFFPWQKETRLDVIMGDVLSDFLLDSSDYRAGNGRDGIKQAGKWLVDKHLALFEHLLQESKRNSSVSL
jgi:hypothetical protein